MELQPPKYFMWENSKKGFSLIELLAVMAVMGGASLIMIGLTRFSAGQAKASKFSETSSSFQSRLAVVQSRATQTVRFDQMDPPNTFNAAGTSPVGTGRGPITENWILDDGGDFSDLDQIPQSEKNLSGMGFINVQNFINNNLIDFRVPFSDKLQIPIRQDSHLLEAPKFTSDENGNMVKIYSAYLVSRCLPRNQESLKVVGDGIQSINPNAPWLSAFFVLRMVERRPFFVRLKPPPQPTFELRCCPAGQPNCVDGRRAGDWLLRTYLIKFILEDCDLRIRRGFACDPNTHVSKPIPVAVTELPSPADLDPVIGAGFMLALDLPVNQFNLSAFTLENRCLYAAGKHCNFFQQRPADPHNPGDIILRVNHQNGVLAKTLQSGGLIKIAGE